MYTYSNRHLTSLTYSYTPSLKYSLIHIHTLMYTYCLVDGGGRARSADGRYSGQRRDSGIKGARTTRYDISYCIVMYIFYSMCYVLYNVYEHTLLRVYVCNTLYYTHI